MYELLEQGLTPQSARRAGDALALISMELVSGRRPSGLLPPDVSSMQPGLLSKERSLVETVSQAFGMAFGSGCGNFNLVLVVWRGNHDRREPCAFVGFLALCFQAVVQI